MRLEAERRAIPATNVICTGDVVAYAASPEATTRLIRDWGIHVVAGNCEEQLAEGAEDCGCGFEEGSVCDRLSRGWYPYALDHTSAASRAWMAGLPTRLDFVYAGASFAVLHGGATQNNRFLFGSEIQSVNREFADVCQEKPCSIVLAGHAGLPFIAELEHGHWVNAGVIGMPANDGTPNGWYAIINHDQATGISISLRRLAYDYVAAAAEMRRAGHANGYARTLITGVWPSHDVLPAVELALTGASLPEVAERVRETAPVV